MYDQYRVSETNLSSHLKQQQQKKNRQIQDNRHWKIKGIIH